MIGGGIGAGLSIVLMAGAVSFGIVPVASDARLHNYLMTHPKIATEMQAMAEVQEANDELQRTQAAVNRIGVKRFFDPAVAYVTGPANAKNTFVEFYDYNCGHCRNTSVTVKKFYEAHKNNVRFAFVEYPIFGEASNAAARISIAAHNQGDRFLALHFGLMGEGQTAVDASTVEETARAAGLDVNKLQADLAKPAVDKALLASQRLTSEAGFRGTPVFIINGKVHEGEITVDDLKELMKG
jgi:protein-disulfide isomerase